VKTQTLVLVAIFLFLCILAGAQPYTIVSLTPEDGLPTLEINDITQTPDGRIWIASRSGVSSYNGIQFTNYTLKDGFTYPVQSFLSLDKSGVLYSLADDRNITITRFENGRWTPAIPEPDSIPFLVLVTGFRILEKNGNPVFGFSTLSHGFYYYDSVWNHITNEKLKAEKISALEIYRNHFILGTDKGLIEVADDAVTHTISKLLPKPEEQIYSLSAGKEGSLLVVTLTRIGKITDNHYSPFCNTLADITSYNSFSRGISLKNSFNDLFVGDEMQLFLYPENQCKGIPFDNLRGSNAKGITCIFEDKDQNTWIGSNRGIHVLYPSNFLTYNKDHGLKEDEITAIEELQPGVFVLGHNMGFTIFDGTPPYTYYPLTREKEFTIHTRIQDMTKDEEGNIYFASSKTGFGKFSNSNITWLKNPVFDHKPGYTSIFYDTTSKKLWVTASGILGYYDKNSRFYTVETGIEDILIRKISKLKDGKIYCGLTNMGILILDEEDKVTHLYNSNDSKDANNVFTLYLDSNETLWIGTNIGLRYYRDKTFYSTLEGYPALSKPVYQINSDHTNGLWIGTEVSLMHFNGSNLMEFTQAEGYFGGETNRDAFLVTQDNRLMFGGSSGLSIFNSKNTKSAFQPKIPSCEITGIQVDSIIYSPYHNIDLRFRDNSFLVSFTPISLSGRKEILQQIMLAGLENNWRTLRDKHTQTAFYSNLQPGVYNFMYRVSNDDGRTWCRAEISGNITVAIPFWQKWWFFLLLFAGIAGVSIIAFSFFTRQQNAIQLKQEVEKRTIELQTANKEKDLFFSIIAHDLKSPFNAIIGFSDILNNDYDSFSEAEKKLFIRNIHDASENTYKLIEKLLDWSRAKTGRLNYKPEMIDLSVLGASMISTYRNAAAKKDIVIKSLFGYHSKVYADPNLLETVFRNLISNAIKYSNPNGEIILSAEKSENYTAISITDQGIGIPPDAVEVLFNIHKKTSTPGTHEEMGTGLGLIVCKEFCEVNKGSIKVSSTPGKGSVFTFTVPSTKPE